MSSIQEKFLADVLTHELEFGHELPNNSFFKSIALDLVRKYWPTLSWTDVKVKFHRGHILG